MVSYWINQLLVAGQLSKRLAYNGIVNVNGIIDLCVYISVALDKVHD